MSKKVRGIVKKYNPQWGLIILESGEKFSVSKKQGQNLKEGLEVELVVKGKNVVEIKILSGAEENENNRNSKIKFSQNKQQRKKENNKNTGVYIVPKYLLHNLKDTFDNFYLSIKKYAFASVENPKKQSVPGNYNEAFKQFLDGRLKLKIENTPNIVEFPNKLEEIKKFIDLYIDTTENLKENGNFKIKEKNFKPSSKLIIGLGSPSIYEVSMTLHHIYGFPYIPAQAIKGVLRNYFINEYFDLSEDKKKEIEDVKEISKVKENLAEENPIFKFIFGSQDSEGNIIFFDAFPVGDIKLQIDIMNNHFPDYYEKDEPPADWQNPNPIKFLVVKDTPFKIFLGIKRNINLKEIKEKLNEFKEKKENHKKFIEDFETKLDSQENLLNHLLTHLNKAFEWYGIGAKTSVGYGYLSKEN